MALRWAAASLDAASKNFNRIMGYQNICGCSANLEAQTHDQQLAQEIKAGSFNDTPARQRHFPLPLGHHRQDGHRAHLADAWLLLTFSLFVFAIFTTPQFEMVCGRMHSSEASRRTSRITHQRADCERISLHAAI